MATKKKETGIKARIVSVRHKDKRANIPTEELRGFVAEDEKGYNKMLYPRDPSLDPQLVWKGKDEQDMKDLSVPVVPIYIQEKIHPQAIIEDIKAYAEKENPQDQLALYSDFNGIKFEDLIDFYKHEQNWSNRLILGDSLQVMTSLAEKEGLKGKVQMIYIDPPYGIKFGSNWQVSTRKRDVKDGKPEDLTRQPEQIRAFRDTWELGIHSYLAYLRDRLVTARELLTETGSVFVQIGDENVHLVRCILDEVFGSENFSSLIVVRKTTGKGSAFLDTTSDFLLWYFKDKDRAKYRQLFFERDFSEDVNIKFIEFSDYSRRLLTEDEKNKKTTLPKDARLFRHNPLTSQTASATTVFSYSYKTDKFSPGKGGWKTNYAGMEKLEKANRLIKSGNTLSFVRYFDDFPYAAINNIWDDTRTGGFGDEKIYVVQTIEKVIHRCLAMTTDPGDLVLDPTCGSGTTAYVAEQWGRRWITIDTSRVALALARTRIMSAKYPYYILSDTPDGIQKESEISGHLPPDMLPKTEGDIKKGFVYKRVPHITLKSIANNPDIDAIHSKWQEKLEPMRAELNKQLKEKWEEWEIPRDAPISQNKGWPEKAKKLLNEYWKLRRERQKEIDDSIQKNADTEILYDQPYEDKKRLRVAGPFTVESLSPHRVLAADEELPASEIEGRKASASGQFANMIIENLKKAGVQNTKKGERLKFDRLEPFAGTWIQATGEYTEKDKSKRVAVCIGPEHGTVGPELIKEAAKEAVEGIGFDLLIVCGFAFDPHVSEEARRYGKLTVLTARINPDLGMDELLKKTGAGNLFMVFGEPDIEVNKQKDGKISLEIKGLDIYDPTTGAIRSSSTDDIACWFIDTNYNGESFFVRHAYFLGADKPYEKLKKALKADVDESAWESLYTTASRPFEAPKTGKIAVKVINHYGDEVLKVFQI